jgi:hypothetical protein
MLQFQGVWCGGLGVQQGYRPVTHTALSEF